MFFDSPHFIVTSRDGNHSFGSGAADIAQALEKLDAMAVAGFDNLSCVDEHGRKYSREELIDLAGGSRADPRKRRKAPRKRTEAAG